MPIVAVELGDGVAGILRSLKSDDTGALGTAIGCDVNVSAEDLAIVSSLTEEVLQVLPADVVRKLDDWVSTSCRSKQGEYKKGTNIGDVDLSSCTTSSSRVAAEATSKTAARVHSAAKVTASGAARGAESRLGLSVFANVYESAHEVLVAERCNSVLRLLPGGIFHDTTALHPSKSQSTSILLTIKTSHHPLPLTFRSAVARRLRRGLLQLFAH